MSTVHDKRRQPRVSLDLLRGFRAAAKHLSFVRAARELLVTPQALAFEIRTLEDQIGKPLFRHDNRTLHLTDAGRELYRAAELALGAIDAATERINTVTKKLSLTTTSALASLWLAPKLPGLMRGHQGIDVRIVASEELVDIEREEIDVALRYIPPGMKADGDLLVDCLHFPVCAPAYAANRRDPITTIDSLRKHVIVDLDTLLYGETWSDWDAWLGARDIRHFHPAGTLRLQHYDKVIQAAKEGSGIAMGKWPHVMREIREGSLCAPLGEPSITKVGGYHIQVRPAVAGSAVVRTFVGWMRDEVRRDGRLTLQPGSGGRQARVTRNVTQRGASVTVH